MPGRQSPRRYFKEVRFRQIRALIEIADKGSFAEAARHMQLSTPSVWRQVRALETEFGVPLVNAQGRQLELTEHGRLLTELATPLVEGFHSLKRQFADRSGRLPRRLHLVVPTTILNGTLRDVIREYRELNPQVGLQLTDMPSRSAWEALAEGQADIALVNAPQGDQIPHTLEQTPLARFPFQISVPSGHPLLKTTRLTLRDVLRHPVILFGDNSSARLQFDHRVARAGLSSQVQIAMTAGNLSIMLQYAALGLGVVFLTRSSFEATPLPPGLPPLVCRDVSHLLGFEQMVLLKRRRHHELPHVRQFRELVCSRFGSSSAKAATR
jgi:molybdate transport repressor ModE-like protein